MTQPGFENLTPDQFRRFVAETHEKRYLLVDVRQPDEYEARHIPGARHLPLLELQRRLYELPSDRDLIFYCHSGGRSLMAADLAAEGEVTAGRVFNLVGGIMGYDGKTLADVPRLRFLDPAQPLPDLLATAMSLEKGAWRFYTLMRERFANDPRHEVLTKLAAAETAHAKALFQLLPDSGTRSFEEMYGALSGDILEGGVPLAQLANRYTQAKPADFPDMLEMALTIEYAAYDLYRAAAEHAPEEVTRDALLSIAQAEKAHMGLLAKALADRRR